MILKSTPKVWEHFDVVVYLQKRLAHSCNVAVSFIRLKILALWKVTLLWKLGHIFTCFSKSITGSCLSGCEFFCSFKLANVQPVFCFPRESTTLQWRRGCFKWHFKWGRGVYQHWHGPHTSQHRQDGISRTTNCCYPSNTRLKLTQSCYQRMMMIQDPVPLPH